MRYILAVLLAVLPLTAVAEYKVPKHNFGYVIKFSPFNNTTPVICYDVGNGVTVCPDLKNVPVKQPNCLGLVCPGENHGRDRILERLKNHKLKVDDGSVFKPNSKTCTTCDITFNRNLTTQQKQRSWF